MPLSAEIKALIAEMYLAPIHSSLFEILQKLEKGGDIKPDLLALMKQIREDAV